MKSFFAQLAIGILLLVAGTTLGMVVEKYRTNDEGKLRYLELDVIDNIRIISSPNIPGKNIEIRLDGEKIDALSEVRVRIYNHSDRDYEKVPIFITFKPEAGNAISVVSEQVVGVNDLPEVISKTNAIKPLNEPNALKYGYVITTANRTTGREPVFKASYTIIGTSVPKVYVATTKKGLRLREYDYMDLYVAPWYLRYWWLPVAVYFIFIAVYYYWRHRRSSARSERLETELIEDLSVHLSKEENKTALSLTDENKINDLARICAEVFLGKDLSNKANSADANSRAAD